jgi:hypothetical protein
VTRAAARATGLAVIVAYVIGALVSARLSPFSRRPLLDGLAPVAPYRWASPPPALAATNKPPTPGRFTLSFSGGALAGGAFQTPDAQVTLIVSHGAIAPKQGQRSVEVNVDPEAPSEGPGPPRDTVILGNLVRIRATYRPSGEAVTRLRRPIEVVLLYPFVRSDSGEHLVLQSTGGGAWRTLRATDHVGSAQLIASVRSLGTVAAAGRRLSGTPPAPSAGGSDHGTFIGIVVGAVGVLVLLVLVFGRRGDERRRRGPPAAGSTGGPRDRASGRS